MYTVWTYCYSDWLLFLFCIIRASVWLQWGTSVFELSRTIPKKKSNTTWRYTQNENLRSPLKPQVFVNKTWSRMTRNSLEYGSFWIELVATRANERVLCNEQEETHVAVSWRRKRHDAWVRSDSCQHKTRTKKNHWLTLTTHSNQTHQITRKPYAPLVHIIPTLPHLVRSNK